MLNYTRITEALGGLFGRTKVTTKDGLKRAIQEAADEVAAELSAGGQIEVTINMPTLGIDDETSLLEEPVYNERIEMPFNLTTIHQATADEIRDLYAEWIDTPDEHPTTTAKRQALLDRKRTENGSHG